MISEPRLFVDEDEEEQIRMSLIRLCSSCGVLRACIGGRTWLNSVFVGVGVRVSRGVHLLNSSTRIVLNEVYSRSCM